MCRSKTQSANRLTILAACVTVLKETDTCGTSKSVSVAIYVQIAGRGCTRCRVMCRVHSQPVHSALCRCHGAQPSAHTERAGLRPRLTRGFGRTHSCRPLKLACRQPSVCGAPHDRRAAMMLLRAGMLMSTKGQQGPPQPSLWRRRRVMNHYSKLDVLIEAAGGSRTRFVAPSAAGFHHPKLLSACPHR